MTLKSSEQSISDEAAFQSWWKASKYCQVVYPKDGWEQIARDGWVAALSRRASACGETEPVGWEDACPSCGGSGRYGDAAQRAIDAPSLSPAHAAVKELEWVDNVADTPFGDYWIVVGIDARVRLGAPGWSQSEWKKCTTAEEAQAAAEADYRSRILSALEPQEAEAVAWRLTTPDGAEYLFNVQDNALSYAEATGGNVTSLYAHPVSPKPPASTVTEAARDVLAERSRQVESEGWTAEHDDKHDRSEIADAAACYALAARIGFGMAWKSEIIQRFWPWAFDWWKPSNPRRNLVKAGALILAEIERLDRAALSNQANGGGK